MSTVTPADAAAREPRADPLPEPVPGAALAAAVADAGRLAAVHATGLLDTPPERAFDRLVALSARLLRAPVALMTLVEEGRDFVKAHVGLPEPLAAARAIRATPTFCQDAIARHEATRAAAANGEAHDGAHDGAWLDAVDGRGAADPTPVAVEDAAASPYYCTFPAVQAFGVRACLTVPLVGAGGHALGSLCVISYEPRTWAPDDVATLADLASAAAAEVALRAAARADAARLAALEVAYATLGAQAAELEALNEQLGGQAGELEAQQAELEQQLEASRAMADALEASNAQLHTANAAKAQFLASMSHELRTPLNAIGGYTQLLEMGVHGPVTPAQREALERVQRAQQHLLGLINSVLNYARIEAGAVRYEIAPVPLAGAMAEAAALVAPQARARELALAVGAADDGADDGGRPLAAMADAEKVRQVLLNLLSNAVKFTPAGGRVTVGARPAGAGRVAVWVRDTGVGIAADQLEQVFDPFVQVGRQLTSGHEGTGLGLAISRDLARGMGGALTAESAPGAGSTFTLVLPAA